MAAYGNVKVRVFIHPANPGEEDGAVGTMARDINDYIVSLDSDDNEVVIKAEETIAKKAWVDSEPPVDQASLISDLQAKVKALEDA